VTPAPAEAAREAGFASVVFDCDSTLVRIEGIDELAGPSRIAEIRRMTDLAMQGELALEEVYGRRLALIDPSRDAVAAVSRAYLDNLVDDARETVAALLWLGKTVRIVSGGLRPPVEALATELGIPEESVAAVGISFDHAGQYLDFERASPLARSGGKLDVVSQWQLPRPSLLVGDGATDLEARTAVDSFAAFMGVAYRELVAAEADVVIDSPSLAPVLSLAASTADRARLRGSRWETLLGEGDAYFSSAGERHSAT
jgi:phosphoserine phosphatase